MKGTRALEGDRNKWEKPALLLRKAGEDLIAASGAAGKPELKEWERAPSGR